ncbi:MAG: hypothetical protein D6698_03985 [Gammaproteobacteria bacterium]|nr:MAG: hypothetical protein D6698_03985 [Gammaproteobacteria bacterium]
MSSVHKSGSFPPLLIDTGHKTLCWEIRSTDLLLDSIPKGFTKIVGSFSLVSKKRAVPKLLLDALNKAREEYCSSGQDLPIVAFRQGSSKKIFMVAYLEDLQRVLGVR